MKGLVLVKFGGSLITDKRKPFTVRPEMLRAASRGLKEAVTAFPQHDFIVGNGAGSFGHYTASQDAENSTPEAHAKRIAMIHQSVVDLNKLFVDSLASEGVRAHTVIPASIITGEAGTVKSMHSERITSLLSEHAVVSVFGDIVADGTDRGLILSTETIFELLLERLHADYSEIRVALCGEVPGVLDADGSVIPIISAETWKSFGGLIQPPPGYDVTGGMMHKIESALRMAHSATSVHIISGADPQTLTAALQGAAVGTKVTA